MKKLFVSAAMLLTASFVSAQELEKLKDDYYSTNKEVCKDTVPMSSGAFDRFLTKHYSFTILGSVTPATGLKIETASPSIALKGLLAKNSTNTFLSTLELQTGTDAKLMEVFSQNKLNNYFKASIGFNFLAPNNWAKYVEKKNLLCTYRNLGRDKYDALLKISQNTAVLKALMDIEDANDATYAKLTESVAPRNISTTDIDAALKQYTQEIGVFQAGSSLDKLVSDFYHYWQAVNQNLDKKEKFLESYQKKIAFSKKEVDSLYNYEIKNVSDSYTTKFIYWANLTPYVNNTNFMEYDPLVSMLNKNSSFLFGLKASVNFFWKQKEKHRFTYLALTVTPQKMNSLDEMTKYNYKKSIEIKVPDPANPNNKETITKDEPGIAYHGLFDSGYGTDVTVEGYCVPWAKGYIPGFYGKVSWNKSTKRLNHERLATYAGLIWNITSSEKESKNLLSIIPFAGWTNLNRQYEDQQKTKVVALHDLFTAGIQLGIPINIGK